MLLEIDMRPGDNVKEAIGGLALAALAAKGPGFTGTLLLRLHVHDGTVGRATAAEEEVIAKL